MTNAVLTSDVSTLTVTIGEADTTVDLGALAPSSIAYLLNYGLSKSLQDAAAGLVKRYGDALAAVRKGSPTKTETKDFETGCEKAGLDPDRTQTGTKTPEAFGQLVATAVKAERLDNILAGKVSIGNGTRLTGIDRIMRDIAIETLSSAAKARGKRIPDADRMAELVAIYLTKHDALVRAEAERRMSTPAVDLDDMFA